VDVDDPEFGVVGPEVEVEVGEVVDELPMSPGLVVPDAPAEPPHADSTMAPARRVGITKTRVLRTEKSYDCATKGWMVGSEPSSRKRRGRKPTAMEPTEAMSPIPDAIS
jgi:hypothetical protein